MLCILPGYVLWQEKGTIAFQMQPEAAILWRKIRIFLPCRVGHRILCLSMFGLSTRCVRQIHRQWADFLVPLVAPLHRQYKTARTETRYHLLLKTRQMITQTSASRGYVVFSGANKGHTQKSLNCLRFADTPRGMFQTWKNTDDQGCPTRHG